MSQKSLRGVPGLRSNGYGETPPSESSVFDNSGKLRGSSIECQTTSVSTMPKGQLPVATPRTYSSLRANCLLQRRLHHQLQRRQLQFPVPALRFEISTSEDYNSRPNYLLSHFHSFQINTQVWGSYVASTCIELLSTCYYLCTHAPAEP